MDIKVLDQCVGEKYALYNGDSCEIIKNIPDNSIHYTYSLRRLQACIHTATATGIWETARMIMSFIIILSFLQRSCIA